MKIKTFFTENIHYINVLVILIFSLTCCGFALKCNDTNCGDNIDRSDLFNTAIALIVFTSLYGIITIVYMTGKFERFFGLWYFLTLCIGIITASFALQCSESCDQYDEDLRTATRAIAGFLISWTAIAGGYGFYKYMKSDGKAGYQKLSQLLGEFTGFLITDKEAKDVLKQLNKQW
jgi:hypothetical protein